MVLSTHGVKDVGLPPASPSDKESLPVVSDGKILKIGTPKIIADTIIVPEVEKLGFTEH